MTTCGTPRFRRTSSLSVVRFVVNAASTRPEMAAARQNQNPRMPTDCTESLRAVARMGRMDVNRVRRASALDA